MLESRCISRKSAFCIIIWQMMVINGSEKQYTLRNVSNVHSTGSYSALRFARDCMRSNSTIPQKVGLRRYVVPVCSGTPNSKASRSMLKMGCRCDLVLARFIPDAHFRSSGSESIVLASPRSIGMYKVHSVGLTRH